MSEEPLLKPEEVASVLAPDGEAAAATAQDDGRVGPASYSLREPVAIPREGEAGARERMEKLIEAFETVLRRELESDLSLELDGFQQQRAAAAVDAVPAPAWVASFAHNDGGGIALVLNPLTALAVVEMALGGFGNVPETGRAPTPLETRVMNRLSAALVPPLVKATGEDLSNATVDVGRLPGNLASPGEIVGVALVRFKLGETQHTSTLVASTPLLLPRRRADEEQPLTVGPVHGVLRRCRVDTRAVLRAGMVCLGDLMELKSGDVLRLDVPSDSPLDLRVSDQTVFTGRIGRDDGPTFTVEWRRGRAPKAGAKEKR